MVAYYCLHELHMPPSEFFALPRRERAFIVAAIEIRAENEAKRQKEAERKAAHGGR